uniref:Putative dna mismatch repair protein n=1 Tax=Ixodes ricinus TaxID=34613 RepID=A0A147BG33_IXORI
MELRALPADVISKLRSGVAIVSIAHCMEEVVLNSLDAGATCVAVRLNLPYHKVQVVDNGHGMSREQLSVCGERYSTSKCRTLSDLENPKFYGYRGEAIASLVEMSGMLQIESRAAGSDESHCKIFTRGHMQELSSSSSKRPSVGTTVTVLDFMFNLPVRRSSVSETIDFEFCLQLLEGLALSHPEVSFTLRDDISGEIRFQAHKSGSVLETFSQLFGKRKAASLKHATLNKKKFAVQAYLSMEGHTTRCLQFAYLNKRLLLKTRIHKLFHNVLKKYVLRYQTQPGLPMSPTKLRNKYPIFVVFVKCLTKTYDITFEPRKTLVEFANWDTVTKAFECLLNGFLREHKIISHSFVLSGDLPFTQKTTPEKAEMQPLTKKIDGDINVDEVPNALLSMKAFRNRHQDVNRSEVDAKTMSEAESMLEDQAENEDPPFISSEGSRRTQTVTSEKSSVEKECASLRQELHLPDAAIMLPPTFSNTSQNRVQLHVSKKSSFINIAHRFRFDRRDKQIQSSNACKNKRQHGGRHCFTRVPGSVTAPGTCSKQKDYVPESMEALAAQSSRILNREDKQIQSSNACKDKRQRGGRHCFTRVPGSVTGPGTCSKQKDRVPESMAVLAAQSPKFLNGQDTQNILNIRIEPRVPPVYLPVCNPTPLATKLRRKMTKISKETSGTGKISAQEVPRPYFVGQQELVPNQDSGIVSKLATTAPTYPCTTESFLNAAQDVFAKEIETHACPAATETFVIPSKISRLERQEDARELISGSGPCKEMVSQAGQVQTSQPFVTTQEFDVSHLQQSIEAEDGTLGSVEDPRSCSFIQLGTDSHHDSSASASEDVVAVAGITLLHFESEDWSAESCSAVQDQGLHSHFSKEVCSVIQCGQSLKETPAIDTAQSFLQCNTLELTSLDSENWVVAGHNVQSDGSSRGGVDGSKKTTGSYKSEQKLSLEASKIVGNCLISLLDEQSLENMETEEKLEGLTQVSPVSAGELDSVRSKEELLPEVSDKKCLHQEDECGGVYEEIECVEGIQHKEEHGTMYAGNWMAWVDVTSGQTMYINVTSGNSAFAPLPCFKEDHQGARELPILDMTLRALPGPSLLHFPPRPLAERAQFGSSPDAKHADVVDLVKVWNNPTFTRCSLQDVLGAVQRGKSTSMTACYGITQSYKFTKEMLSHVKVIGQVDAKFIACLMPVCDKGMFQEDSLIVLFDQHAAHERARLEWLLENQYKDGQGSCLKSSSLKPPLSIALDPDVARRVAVCEKELRKLGVHFGAMTQQGLVLERLPSCLIERDDSERRCGRPSTIATQAQELLREHTEVLLSTRRSAISLPKVLLDVLSSQACRGAIKFGSVLDLSECRKMLAALSRCSLPFQCAHGRPSLSPVVDLRFLPPDKAPNRPNLAKLQGRIAAPASQVQVP